MKRALFVSALLAFSVNATADAIDQKIGTCKGCHAAGLNGAPKIGNAADWEPRLAKGMDVLVTSVKAGTAKGMPGGMCIGCSDDDIKAVIARLSGSN